MEKQRLSQQRVLVKPVLVNRQRGFTLIELILVIIIIGIITAAYASVILPGNGAGIRLNSTANQVATDIRLAQSLAMSLNQRRQVNFSANSYGVTDTSNNPAWLNSATITFNPMISITSTTPASIIFNGRGVPYSKNTTPLTGNFQVVLQATGSNQRTITVFPDTGSVGVTNP